MNTMDWIHCANTPGMAAPSYLQLSNNALRRRAESALLSLQACRICPRNCGVNRLENHWSACKTGRDALVNSYFPHFGEEDCLRGWRGSGTIFFSHCNLRCVFCQNFDVSQGVRPHVGLTGTSPDVLAGMMLKLQHVGCHNINFVTPEHVVPQVLEALVPAVEGGLKIPIVYNTSAYDSPESLHLLDGIVDIYMPDLKLWSNTASKRYLMAENYPAAARSAILEMHRQVGPLVLDDRGLAIRGLLIRHLVMPGLLSETEATLRWIRHELGAGTYVNIMDQYRPAGKVGRGRFAEIDRTVSSEEYAGARSLAMDLGLRLDERTHRS